MTPTDAKSFGATVRLLRTLLGLDQATLAQRMGVTPAAVSHLECGRRAPSLDTLYAVKRALGCGWDVLLDGPKRPTDWPRGGYIDTDIPPGRTIK